MVEEDHREKIEEKKQNTEERQRSSGSEVPERFSALKDGGLREKRRKAKRQGKINRTGFGFLKAAANAVLILLNGFVFVLIVCLFLSQPERGERVKPTIQNFQSNAEQYYSEDEVYQQVNDNVHVYQSEGRPD